VRFLVDECAGPALARWLRQQDHEVFSVYEDAGGMKDEDILEKAFVENWILLTADKDFGEKVYREQHPHHGVILLRLVDERASSKIGVIAQLLELYADQLSDRYVVVTECCSHRTASPLRQTVI
jgi:predicted nuclease of predicted toxin-antitoxin system